MAAAEQAERLFESLRSLGGRKLAALGVIGVLVFALTGLAGYMLSRPSYEPLYSGLDRADVGTGRLVPGASILGGVLETVKVSAGGRHLTDLFGPGASILVGVLEAVQAPVKDGI